MNAGSTVRFNVLRLKGWVFKGDQQIKKKKKPEKIQEYMLNLNVINMAFQISWVSKGWTIQ